MFMQTETSEERMALLLGLLGPDVADPVLERLPAEQRQRLRDLQPHVQSATLDRAEVAEVIDEFMRFFRFALQQTSAEPQLRVVNPDARDEDEQAGDTSGQRSKHVFEPSGDSFADLNRLMPVQIAGALRSESPRTMAVVLNCLDPQKAGDTLKHVAAEVRGSVFVQLQNPPAAPQALLERVVRTTVEKGCQIDGESVADPEEEVNRKLAELLRNVGQQDRGEMLTALAAQDAEVAAKIRQMLYVFEDLANVADRAMQKLLSEVNSETLCRALKGADDAILSNVMNNLSKRARATLAEEMEFLGNVKPNEIEECRTEICNLLARLDESGDLEMK
jgi:flagellar motor switch protein FliG